MDWITIGIIVGVAAAAGFVAHRANPDHVRNKGLICSMQPEDPNFTVKGADLKSERSLRDEAAGSGSEKPQEK